MLVYTKTRVVTLSFLFTGGTATRVMVTLLLLLGLTSLLSFYIGLKHGLHKGHALIAPKLFVWLLGLRGGIVHVWVGQKLVICHILRVLRVDQVQYI